MNRHVPDRPTWIEVDRSALVNNVHQVRRIIGDHCLLMAVVKANAYGHGAVATAQVMGESAGADRFAVATLAEARELRAGGVEAQILVLGYTPPWQASEVIGTNVAVTIYDLETALALNAAAADLRTLTTAHVKVNTGMNRLGLTPSAVPAFIEAVGELEHVRVEGIFTHFATADVDRAFAYKQFDRFGHLLRTLESEGLRPPIAHAANSAATLTMPETHLQMVRCGIALYGLDPDEETATLPTVFEPALSWKAKIAQVTELQAGEGVSYGLEFVAAEPTVVAVIPVGYADGFPRRPQTWGSVLIRGEAAPIVGRVCMDQTVVDVTGIVTRHGPVRQDDEVVLIGNQGQAHLSAQEVGRRIGTINYDVVSRIMVRVPRMLVDGEG